MANPVAAGTHPSATDKQVSGESVLRIEAHSDLMAPCKNKGRAKG